MSTVQKFLGTGSNHSLEAGRPVIGADIKVVAQSPHLILKDNERNVLSPHYHIYGSTVGLEPFDLRIYGSCPYSACNEKIPAAFQFFRGLRYELRRHSEGAHHIGKTVTDIISAHFLCGCANSLYHYVYSTGLAVIIAYRKRDPFALLVVSDNQELPRSCGFCKARRFDRHAAYIVGKPLFLNYTKHLSFNLSERKFRNKVQFFKKYQ